MLELTDEQKARGLLWAEALESGKYTQGYSQLRRQTYGLAEFEWRHCCLGVACEVFAEHAPDQGHWKGDLFETYMDSSRAYLPDGVSKWFGVDRSPRMLFDNLSEKVNKHLWTVEERKARGAAQMLAALGGVNDTRLVPFLSIAKAIRNHYGLPQIHD